VVVSVNVSPETVVSPFFHAALRGAPPERLVLEITEHARVDDYDTLLRALAPSRQAGTRLAVDDAGAGFSSFRHILRLEPDFIKLDIEITPDIDSDPVRKALASALVTFGTTLGATIIAEGVETKHELEALQSMGVECGQGFLLGVPQPLSLRLARDHHWADGA
jgi:EAL domain-containing protein (putative c-di-GMP-specific phosphodiesterase class I)